MKILRNWEISLFVLVILISVFDWNILPFLVYTIAYGGTRLFLNLKGAARIGGLLGIASCFIIVSPTAAQVAVASSPSADPEVVDGPRFHLPIYEDVEWWETGLVSFELPPTTQTEVDEHLEQVVVRAETHTAYVLLNLPEDPGTIMRLYGAFGSWDGYNSALKAKAMVLLDPDSGGDVMSLEEDFAVVLVKMGQTNSYDWVFPTLETTAP